MDGFTKIKQYLEDKQEEIANKLRDLAKEQSDSAEEAPESVELGTYSWQADTDSTKMAVKQELVNFSKDLQKTLSKLQKGTYGQCEKCKRFIEEARLEIIPTAAFCIACSEAGSNISRFYS